MCTVFFLGFKKFLAMYSKTFLTPALLNSLFEGIPLLHGWG